jgi:hypothetical protein
MLKIDAGLLLDKGVTLIPSTPSTPYTAPPLNLLLVW